MAKDQKRIIRPETNSLPTGAVGFLLTALMIILLHLWGAVNPSHRNWGFHFYAFFSPLVGATALLLALLSLLPAVNGRMQNLIETVTQFFSRLPRLMPPLIAMIGLTAAALLWSVKLHLLGDGAVLLRSNAMVDWGNDLVQSFSNQPLMRIIYRGVWNFFSASTAPGPHDVYLWIDLGAGVFFIGILFWFFERLEAARGERLLAAAILLCTGPAQFFFGYVENYVLQFVVGIFFLLAGWLALRNKLSPLLPLLCLCILAGLHLGFLIFTPAAAFLLYFRFRNNLRLLVALFAGVSITAIVLLFLSGFTPQNILRHLTAESVDFLQPFSANGGNFPYPMFSFRHFFDWSNGVMLTAPFVIPIAAGLLITRRKRLPWQDPVLLFLLLASACGLLFTWVINFALGIARDWDLFSTFLIPLFVLDVYLLLGIEQASLRRYLLTATAILGALHMAAWIGLNANAEKQLARMQLLNDPYFLSPSSQLVYDEALANYYFDGGSYPDAKRYYEHFMTIDNHNPRIIGNMADTYRKLGEKGPYFAMLRRAVELNSKDPGVYTNIGVEYASRGDTAQAIAFNERAVAIDPGQRLAHANLGILYAATGNYPLADRHFASALGLGMRDPTLYLYAGDVAALLKDYRRALQFYNSYLELVPNDRRVRAARDAIRAMIPAGQPQRQR
jgi:hypothetical protein